MVITVELFSENCPLPFFVGQLVFSIDAYCGYTRTRCGTRNKHVLAQGTVSILDLNDVQTTKYDIQYTTREHPLPGTKYMINKLLTEYVPRAMDEQVSRVPVENSVVLSHKYRFHPDPLRASLWCPTSCQSMVRIQATSSLRVGPQCAVESGYGLEWPRCGRLYV